MYSPVASLPATAGNVYVDSSLTNGNAYSYVVTATVSGVESPYSPMASAAPLVQDNNWKITPPPTQTLTDPSVSTTSAVVSASLGTALITSAGVYGANLSRSSSASYPVGTWTFQWTGASWPTLYVIKHQKKTVYMATVGGGTGTASVTLTGRSALVSAAFPITGTANTQRAIPTFTFNTSDVSNPIFTSVSSSHITGAGPAPGTTSGPDGSWTDTSYYSTVITTAYTSQYFQAHFATPANIVFNLQSAAANITASSTLSNATAAGNSVATGSVIDVYAGQ